MTPLTDLLAHVVAGDALARTKVIEAALTRLEALARSMFRKFPSLRAVEETWDVLNNSLVRLDRALQASVPKSSAEFFSLAAEQIRRVLLDLTKYYASGTRGTFRRMSEALPLDHNANEPVDPEQDAASLDRWVSFHVAVEGLPSDVRAVFELHFYRGLSKVDIAEVLGVAVQTVYRRWHTAVMHLHEAIGEDLPAW